MAPPRAPCGFGDMLAATSGQTVQEAGRGQEPGKRESVKGANNELWPCPFPGKAAAADAWRREAARLGQLGSAS